MTIATVRQDARSERRRVSVVSHTAIVGVLALKAMANWRSARGAGRLTLNRDP